MFSIEIKQTDGTWYRIKRNGAVITFTTRTQASHWAFGYDDQRGNLSTVRAANVRFVAI